MSLSSSPLRNRHNDASRVSTLPSSSNDRELLLDEQDQQHIIQSLLQSALRQNGQWAFALSSTCWGCVFCSLLSSLLLPPSFGSKKLMMSLYPIYSALLHVASIGIVREANASSHLALESFLQPNNITKRGDNNTTNNNNRDEIVLSKQSKIGRRKWIQNGGETFLSRAIVQFSVLVLLLLAPIILLFYFLPEEKEGENAMFFALALANILTIACALVFRYHVVGERSMQSFRELECARYAFKTL